VLCKKLNPPDDEDDEQPDVTLRAHHVYNVLTPSDRALALLYYANNYNNWVVHKKCLKDSSAGGNVGEDDELEADGGADDEGTWASRNRGKWYMTKGRRKYAPGFTEEGMRFYKAYLSLFISAQEDAELCDLMRFESITYWDDHGRLVPRRASRKKKRSAPSAQDAEPPKVQKLSDMASAEFWASTMSVPEVGQEGGDTSGIGGEDAEESAGDDA